jgi:hypothetical protein
LQETYDSNGNRNSTGYTTGTGNQYDGFGNLTSNSNASFSDRYHLQGRELDPTTTLTYFRA